MSTAVRDIVTPYGRNGTVVIADELTFSRALDAALELNSYYLCSRADAVLSQTSWEKTYDQMARLINARLQPARDETMIKSIAV